MEQKMIPCLLMRGGTSRGAYFLKEHLPRDRAALDRVLLKVMGSPDALQIDGVGGATTTTTKVAVLSRSREPVIDVDFLFAQVSVTTAVVDWGPACGNILAGVGPAAVEMGLIPDVRDAETKVRIRSVNTGGFVEAVVETPGGQVSYEGDAAIDGAPGIAAPVELNFVHAVGSQTRKLLPTRRLRDLIDGVEVTCTDCAVPTVVARASALGKTGYESKLELDLDVGFFRRIEAIRRIAGDMMGLGDVACRVIPKFAIVAEARRHRNLTARYLVPTMTHPSMAVTGGIAISCCSLLQGTVAHEVAAPPHVVGAHTHHVIVEHSSGEIPLVLKAATQQPGSAPSELGLLDAHSAGAVRTARLLFTGMVRVPSTVELEPITQPDEYRQMSDQFSQLYRPRQKPRKLRGKSLPSSPRVQHSSSVGSSVTFASPRPYDMSDILVQAMVAPAVRYAHQDAVGSICQSPARYASLKAPRPKPKEKGTTAGKPKSYGDIPKTDVSSSPSGSSMGMSKVERSNSIDSDGGDSLDAELLARLQALKGPSVPPQMSEGESTSKSYSESNTPTLSEYLQALKSRSKRSPPMSPSGSDYPAGMTISSTSVGSSGWCAPTSPFKLMKALSIKKPAPDQSSKSQSSQTKDAKKAVKRSLSHTSKEDDQVDPSAMVAEVQRLLAAVSKEGRSERDQSTVKEAMTAGDKRTFNMKDRDVELLKAMEDEEAIALEAEKVVEWAKDNARLEGSDEESEDELEVSCSDYSDDSTGAKLMSVKKKTVLLEDSDPEETTGKPKKRKGRRRWNFL